VDVFSLPAPREEDQGRRRLYPRERPRLGRCVGQHRGRPSIRSSGGSWIRG